MRFRFAVLVAVTSVLTVASPALAGRSATSDWAYVKRMLFQVPLGQFVATARHGDAWFDWSTDLCSAPLVGSTGWSFDFRDACRRHDFGYRNLRLLERRYGSGRTYWNATNRHAVDRVFLGDMRLHCQTRSSWLQPRCLWWASTFYTVVRAVAGP